MLRRLGGLRTAFAAIGLVLLVMCISEMYLFTGSLHTAFRKIAQERLVTVIPIPSTNNRHAQSRRVNAKQRTSNASYNDDKRISQQPVSHSQSMLDAAPRRAFTKVHDLNIYILSAVAATYRNFVDTNNEVRQQYSGHNETQGSKSYTYHAIVLNGWEDRRIEDSKFKCCFRLTNGTVVDTVSLDKRNWGYAGMTILQAKQYVCPVSFDRSMVEFVSLTSLDLPCVFNGSSFLRPAHPPNQHGKGIALCSKLVYGSLDPGRLLEWLEVHRYLRVSTILVYTHRLNDKALEILRYYEKLGFVQRFDFDLPGNEFIQREVGTKTMQSWNDEQVAVFDCQERLSSYKYVAVIDTDEFLVTDNNMGRNALKQYLDSKWKTMGNIAGISFHSKIHVTDWGPATSNSSLFIGRYLNSTAAFSDRSKNVYMPTRIVAGSVSTHVHRRLPAYSVYRERGDVASIHHYRSCRPEWRTGKSPLYKWPKNLNLRQYRSNDLLHDFQRYPSVAMENLARAVEQNVTKQKALFGI